LKPARFLAFARSLGAGVARNFETWEGCSFGTWEVSSVGVDFEVQVPTGDWQSSVESIERPRLTREIDPVVQLSSLS